MTVYLPSEKSLTTSLFFSSKYHFLPLTYLKLGITLPVAEFPWHFLQLPGRNNLVPVEVEGLKVIAIHGLNLAAAWPDASLLMAATRDMPRSRSIAECVLWIAQCLKACRDEGKCWVELINWKLFICFNTATLKIYKERQMYCSTITKTMAKPL